MKKCFIPKSLLFYLVLVIFPSFLMAQPATPVPRGTPGDLWADRVLGQSDNGRPNYAFGSIVPNQAGPRGLSYAFSVVVDTNPGHNMMYVWDSDNSRVLGVTLVSGQVTNGQGATIVLGQPGFDFAACNGDGNWQNYPNLVVLNANCLCGMRP